MGDNKDSNEYEEICDLCRRTSSAAGRMFKLPNDMHICEDCMQKTLESMGSLNLGSFMGMGIPPLNGIKSPAGQETPVEVIPGDRDKGENARSIEEPEKEEGEEKKKETLGQNNPFMGFQGFPNISFLNMSDLQGMLGGRPRVRKKREDTGEEKTPVIDIKDIPQPHRIKEMLDEYVIGQDYAKKVISVAVYNHYKRIVSEGMKKEEFEDRLKNVEIEKSNILMIGPTGCGKTYLVQTLAKLLNVPLAITDATSLTEAGYIGDDIESVVSKLLSAADNDVEKAETGIIFIDEIDKIAKKKNTNSRDVSGESVQQGMLKLLEGAEVEVPVGASSKNAMVPMVTVDTRNILFICGGAFPDLDELIKQRLRKQTSIGFNAELKDSLDKRKDILKEVTVEDVKKFGMIPEFVGRMPIICTLEGLSEDALVRILKEPKNALIKQYQKLLSIDEVRLEFTDDALHAIAKKAIEKDTGARALRSIIEDIMLDIMYEIPKDDNIGTVTITEEYLEGKGSPVIELRT